MESTPSPAEVGEQTSERYWHTRNADTEVYTLSLGRVENERLSGAGKT